MLEAIILAGGQGTRLRELIPHLPKPMAPVAGRPFLEILLCSLLKKGFTRVILSLGFMADKVIDHFGQQFKTLELSYVQEKKPLGTGGAIRLAMTQCQQDHVFVFNGDTYLDLDIDQIEQHWHQHHHPIIVGRQVNDTARYGTLEVNEQQQVISFLEKGPCGPGLINTGCYVLNRDQLVHFPLYAPFSLEKDYLTQAILTIPFDLLMVSRYFIDIGIPEDYMRAQTEMAEPTWHTTHLV